MFQGVEPSQGIGTVTDSTCTPDSDLLKSALPYEQDLKAPCTVCGWLLVKPSNRAASSFSGVVAGPLPHTYGRKTQEQPCQNVVAGTDNGFKTCTELSALLHLITECMHANCEQADACMLAMSNTAPRLWVPRVHPGAYLQLHHQCLELVLPLRLAGGKHIPRRSCSERSRHANRQAGRQASRDK